MTMARNSNNICENTLQLQAKGMERKLHNRLHILSCQASQLRQKIKVLNMEKEKADLEIKKRYFPEHDFQQDEAQLQTSMRRLILQCNQFYLNKKQRYPIRACIKDDKIGTSLSPCSNSKKNVWDEPSNNIKRSKSECSNQPPRSKNKNSSVVSKMKVVKILDSSPERSKTFPEIIFTTEKQEKEAHNLARFSVLLDTEKCSWEDAPAKFPMIETNERDNGQSPMQGSWLEGEKEFDTTLPNIDLREVFSRTNFRTFTNSKSKRLPGNDSSQKLGWQSYRFDKSHFQNLLELESSRLKWKIDNYFRQDKKNAHNKSTETREQESCQVDGSSPSPSEESFRLYREREAMNTVPRDVKQIKQDHNWRLTTPIQKTENFIDNLTVVMMAGMSGLRCHNISFIPLNSARRALRHTPTFKMQQFLKQMTAQHSQAQQFEVNKLQAEFEAILASEMVKASSDQPISQIGIAQEGEITSEVLEPEVTEKTTQAGQTELHVKS